MSDAILKSTSRMESLILQDGKGVFEEDDVAHLRCAIRVAAEFFVYLTRCDRVDYLSSWEDDTDDTRYCIDTIRSGIDSIFVVYSIHHILQHSTPTHLSGKDIEKLASFKRKYLDLFEKALADGIPIHERLGHLVEMGKMQICFIGLAL
jgi:hypothetical protein